MSKNIYTVSEVNAYLKTAIEQNPNFINISLQGEISNITNHSSGHIYFTIKDDKAQIRAIMFAFNAKNLQFKLKEGLKIVATGSIKVYEPQGTYSLQVVSLSLHGVGDLFLKYEALKQELSKKGWFDQSLKKPIPQFPTNIGVITAPTGAAIRDIITTIHRRYPQANIYLFPSLVQGSEAKHDIRKNIKAALTFEPKIDTLIVGRGGGSIEDLWAFNELEVVEAIFQATIPVISAVGHEIDFTLADFVSDLRAPTPTAAAELATPDQKELMNFLNHQQRTLITTIKTKVDKFVDKITELKNSYVLTKPQALYGQQEHSYQLLVKQFNVCQETFFLANKNVIQTYYQRLTTLIQQQILAIEYTKNNLLSKLDLLSPLKTLTRGYSITYNNDKNVLTSIQEVTNNDIIMTRVQDGIIESIVQTIKKDGEENGRE
ncbi:exodeoxyribonuclease VII large subunit [Spiroplasma sp. NBRC 100390]|uniref:exodeoxyribonuclease VII large subunit n=1 Tax=unclassified Spiroplasma TaxID=2637901 RepID=UPI000892960A|nr:MULTISPECIES: exodeoxyribonuclease VII large subunit [unclassified Spiroplasma]AOX43915.1 exodeoxyribonuclease VII large subunit [Spiroplasma sp. TU-14]APE13385.1 exodeoxyribonuclease VII large subunit [Spiroplasma sp. NBRC 100390]